jgi:hypothetical protein
LLCTGNNDYAIIIKVILQSPQAFTNQEGNPDIGVNDYFDTPVCSFDNVVSLLIPLPLLFHP